MRIGHGKSQFISSTGLLILSLDVALQLLAGRVVLLQLLARLAAAVDMLATAVSQRRAGSLVGR